MIKFEEEIKRDKQICIKKTKNQSEQQKKIPQSAKLENVGVRNREIEDIPNKGQVFLPL